MSTSHRLRVPGDTYFFTARLQDRNSTLLVDEIERLRQATRVTRRRHPFDIDAIVVLPNMIHTIWTLPQGDTDYARRWSLLKSLFSRGLSATPCAVLPKRKQHTTGPWQRKFWAHMITSETDHDTHRHLIHTAPVQYRLVRDAKDWPYSSIHKTINTLHTADHVRRDLLQQRGKPQQREASG